MTQVRSGQPRFIPRVDPGQIEQRSERDVALALQETLDEEWTVFHSYNWLRREERLKEGEADFVLVHRRYGLLVLEVKGGSIRFDPDGAEWWQNDHPMQDPFKQAQRNFHALKNQVSERGRFIRAGETPCPGGYAVAFPDVNYQGTLPPGAHGSMLFCARDLPELGTRVRNALRAWAREGTPEDMHANDFEELRKALQSTFRIVPSLARDLEKDEQMLIQLTEQQAEALERIYANPRVLVEGTAGSGKTLLALERSLSFARDGCSVLLLCYNKRLAEWLRRRTEGVEHLKVAHFHGLCSEFCQKAGLAFSPPAEESADFWRYKTAELLLDATDIADDRYDAIVVDEGQDFHDEWWMAIEALQRHPGGPLYVFFDPAQNLFGTGLNLPEGITYNLNQNCRNTRQIAHTCGNVLGQAIKSPRFSPEGVPTEIRGYCDEKEVRDGCAQLLKDVVGSLHASRVALLSPYTRAKSCLNLEKLGPYALVDDVSAWLSGNGVWFSSIRAFKGLEAEVMILVDVDDFRVGKFERQDLFVACSRARHRLYVYTNSGEVRQALLQ